MTTTPHPTLEEDVRAIRRMLTQDGQRVGGQELDPETRGYRPVYVQGMTAAEFRHKVEARLFYILAILAITFVASIAIGVFAGIQMVKASAAESSSAF